MITVSRIWRWTIYRGKKPVNGCLYLGLGVEIDYKWAWGSFLGIKKYSKARLWWQLYYCINLLKITELYIMKVLYKLYSNKAIKNSNS